MIAAGRWTTLLTCVGFAAGARGQTESVEVFVDDPRPLHEAVVEFLKRYPITVTYEDPRFEFSGDIKDVTDQVRRTPNPQNHRTLVPRGSVLETSYAVNKDTGEPVDVASALQAMVEAKNTNPVGGRFAVYQSGQAFHVVPTGIRRRDGAWIPQTSVLDVPISLTVQEANGVELLESILKQASAASGQDIRGPVGPANPLFRYTGNVEAQNESAREVLMATLHSINPRFSWTMSYVPGDRYYVLGIVIGAEPPPPAVDPFVFPFPRPGDPTPAGPPYRPR
jgi:hypothetical protein